MLGPVLQVSRPFGSVVSASDGGPADGELGGGILQFVDAKEVARFGGVGAGDEFVEVAAPVSI